MSDPLRSPSTSTVASPAASRRRIAVSQAARSSAAAEHLVDPRLRYDRHPVAVEHDHVAGLDSDAADRDRHVHLARDVLARACRLVGARPHRDPEAGELVRVAHRAVDEDRRRATDLGLQRHQLADHGHGPRLGRNEDDDLAGPDRLEQQVRGQVVGRAAEGSAGTARGASARHAAEERACDEAATARPFGGRRHPERGEARDRGRIAHQSPTLPSA